MGQQTPFVINFNGGLDLVSPHYVNQTQPGTAKVMDNYEPSISAGYRKINGYARFGMVSPIEYIPSEATAECDAPNYLSDSFWTGVSGISWDGTNWDASAEAFSYLQAGSWNVGFRPSNLDIKVERDVSGTFQIEVKDSGNNTIGSHDFSAIPTATVTSVSIPLTFGSLDLDTIDITTGGYMDIIIHCINFS